MDSLSQVGAGSEALLQLLEQAIGFHTAGDLQKAEKIYREVLVQDPVHPIALHYLGIFLYQNGQDEEGVQNIRLSCALQPDNAAWHNDLGNVLFALREFEEASEAYQASLDAAPHDHIVWNNLGSSQLQHGDTDGAIESFKQALELDADFGPALIHLGNIYEAAGDKMNSAHYQCRAFVLPPHEGKSKQMLGISYYFLGRLQEAAAHYRDWMSEEPDNPIPAHMFAACAQQDVPERASDSYIEKHFDRYAETFNANLVDSLAYRGPELMQQALQVVGVPAKQFDVVDIGCGTGLCEPIIAPYARSLIGVDLSGKMLEQAKARGGYDHLFKQEITDYMTGKTASADLVFSADTMIYFGDLGKVFQTVASTLREKGYFLFTVESDAEAGDQGAGFSLHPSGRYRHSLSYVKRCLNQFGFELLDVKDAVLREEIRQPVLGMVVVARRKS
ncbi:methyltransferase [Herbaspirillum sp. meg3]|uniref:tetratricopeptide repeat protein n=1 Tax=Herbaspirillum sp. meg3 TaxID=2025949 RepID=UPI000B996671|nr:tetratricopeptide repeat protein [Herbaspirillum sp. meg3]ASU39276.1 methyltransferase [Herbaspirillum sp. meg3]